MEDVGDVLERLWTTSLFSCVLLAKLNGDVVLWMVLTGVQKGVLQGTEDLPLGLNGKCGDSRKPLKFQEVSLTDGSSNLRPLGRGTDRLLGCPDEDFWGEEMGVLSSSKVTQFVLFVEHITGVILVARCYQILLPGKAGLCVAGPL